MSKTKKTEKRLPMPNAKELSVLKTLMAGPATLKELAQKFRPRNSRGDVKTGPEAKAQANSWARNSVRRPFAKKAIKKAGRGKYALTDKGRDLLKAA